MATISGAGSGRLVPGPRPRPDVRRVLLPARGVPGYIHMVNALKGRFTVNSSIPLSNIMLSNRVRLITIAV